MDKRGKNKASALTPGAAAMLAHIPVPDDIDGPEADAIVQAGGRARQLRTGRAPPASPEPPRGKVHWDHLLDEMKWMQNEFSSERKIKIKQLKQTATKAVKSKRDLISRSETRAKEQQVKLVKCAQGIARDVMKFWAKARTVYNFMVQEKVNEIKRSKMDKELETFVQQSERFSRMLVGKPTTPASSAQASPEPSAAPQRQLTASSVEQEASGVAHSQEDEPVAADQEGHPSGDSKQSEAVESAGDMAPGDAQPEGPADGEWVESGEEEEDDEETLAAEEALAQQEGGVHGGAEVDELQAEGDEDLAAFMARTYGVSLADFAAGNDTKTAVQCIDDDDDKMLGSSDDDVDLPDEMVAPSGVGASTSKAVWDAGQAGPSTSKAAFHETGPSRRMGARMRAVEGTALAASTSWALDLMHAGNSDANESRQGTSHGEQAGPSVVGVGSSTAVAGSSRSGAALSDMDDEDGELEGEVAGRCADWEGSEEEWMHEEAIDDEATLEEEERLAGAEGYADPEAEKSALESAADQSLAEVAASMGLTLAQLLGQQPPPEDGDEAAEGRPQPAAKQPSPGVDLPQASSLPTTDRPGKVTRRMAAEEQAATQAAKASEQGQNAGAAKADDSEAAVLGDSAGCTKRSTKRARADGVSGVGTAGPADNGSLEPERKSRRSVTNNSPSAAAANAETSSDKEGRQHDDVKHCPHGDGVEVSKHDAHGNDQERVRTPEGTSADMLPGKDNAHDIEMDDRADQVVDASEQNDEQAEVKEKELEEEEEQEEGMEPVQVPFLLTAQMRSYQEAGLNWLVNLCKRNFNGILADEMGLGKTLQTISLLAWLAAECGSWGPHLVVVPTSVMLNWEMEFKKFAPAFKILTYYGTPRERKAKRVGWSKPNSFHVCITSYNLALQDVKIFKRRKWKYLILDEAHMIKNWRSQRWQALLNFSARHRLLITGTPLQNDLMELWSLMHFLMPHIFHSHAQFQDWFSNPLTGMVEGAAAVNAALVSRLHAVLRPFMLRRLKQEVEKQLPQKFEHIVMCRLSRRQRTLYDDFLGARSTKESMSSGSFIAIMNVLMQLRKVCNHPDLFEGRAIISAFDCDPLEIALPKLLASIRGPRESYEDWMAARLMPLWLEDRSRVVEAEAAALAVPTIDPSHAAAAAAAAEEEAAAVAATAVGVSPLAVQALRQALTADVRKRATAAASTALRNSCTSTLRCAHSTPLYGCDLRSAVKIPIRARDVHVNTQRQGAATVPDLLQQLVLTPVQRFEATEEIVRLYSCVIPRARAPATEVSLPSTCMVRTAARRAASVLQEARDKSAPFRTAIIRRHLYFPDRRLIQFDCGKLQQLAVLLQRLKAEGSRCLIFTQMSKMLDVLEAFLNLHAYVYMRLDGSTKPAKRQELMTRFNSNTKYFVFILSTRSGGVGINLTGANCVIFYDSDWNPAMDQQAQDRCHRIGQTREVHIYRLISHHTIEENILRKSNQKRHLDHLAIQSGGYSGGAGPSGDSAAPAGGTSTGAGMGAADIREMLGADLVGGSLEDEKNGKKDEHKGKDTDKTAPDQSDLADEEVKKAMASAEDDADALAASAAEKELAEENAADFDDGGEGTDGKTDGPAVLKATATDAHSMLKPIEKYAVRIWEAEVGPMDYEAMAEAVMQQAQGDERAGTAEGEDPMAQLAAAGAAPTAEADDDNAEENICADWDPDSARTMFWRFLEEEEQKKAAFEAWQAEEAARSAAWAKSQAAAAEAARAQQEAAEKEMAASLAAAGPAVAAVAVEAPKRPAAALAFSPTEDRALCNAAVAALHAGDTSVVKSSWWDSAVSSQGADALRPSGSRLDRAAVLLAAASDGRAEAFRASVSARVAAKLPSSRTAAALASSVADSLYPRRFGATPPGVRAALLTAMSSTLQQSTVQQAPQTQYLVRQLLRSATAANFQSVLQLISVADGAQASVQLVPGNHSASQSSLPSSALRNVAGQTTHAPLQTVQAPNVPLQATHVSLQAGQVPHAALQAGNQTQVPLQKGRASRAPIQAAQAQHAPGQTGQETHAPLQYRQPSSPLAMGSMSVNRGPSAAPVPDVRQAQPAGPSSAPTDSISLDMQWGARKGRGARRSGASRSSVSSQQDGQETQSTAQIAVQSVPGGERAAGSQNTYTQHAPAHMTGVTPGTATTARPAHLDLHSVSAAQKHALQVPQLHVCRATAVSAADLASQPNNPGTATQNSHGIPGSANIMQPQPKNTAVPTSLQIPNPQLLTELQARAQQGFTAQHQLPNNGAAAVQRAPGMGSAMNPILQSDVSAAAARANGAQQPVFLPQHTASRQPVLPPQHTASHQPVRAPQHATSLQPVLPPQHAASQHPVLPPQHTASPHPVLPPQAVSSQQQELLMGLPGEAARAQMQQQHHQQLRSGDQGMWGGGQVLAARPTGGAALDAQTAALLGSASSQQALSVQQQQNGAGLLAQRISASQLMAATARDSGLRDFQNTQTIAHANAAPFPQPIQPTASAANARQLQDQLMQMDPQLLQQAMIASQQPANTPSSTPPLAQAMLHAQLLQDPMRMQQAMMASQQNSETPPHAFSQQPPP